MEQLIILLVIGAISLVNWLIKQSAEARERKKQQGRQDRGEETSVLSEQETTHESTFGPTTSQKEEDPSESMRKLMEALGLPMEEEPPKPAPRPARPIAPPELPKPVYQEPPPLRPREVVVDPYAEKSYDRKKVAPPPVVPSFSRREQSEPEFAVSLESLPSAEMYNWKEPTKRKAEVAREAERTGIRKLLSSRSSVRDAIVLAEVLGKPKAFQD